MTAVITIDPRFKEHHEREMMIFPTLENLKPGESLRIFFEFNPLPLEFLLKQRKDFDVSWEKKGPEEWIMIAKRLGEPEPRFAHLSQLLQEMKEGRLSPETKEKAKDLLKSVDANTFIEFEKRLVEEGVSEEMIRHNLCDIHLEAIRDSLVEGAIEVKAPHPVHTLMEEHKVIVESLDDLANLVARAQNYDSFEDMADDLEELKDISHHLVEAESHHQREEDVIFPRLEAHNIAEPASIMRADHVEFRQRKQALFKLAHNPEGIGFDEFKRKVIEYGEYLASELNSHIFKEDNIVYQIALQILTAEEWDEIKRECDKIGYCCFTPEDQPKHEGHGCSHDHGHEHDHHHEEEDYPEVIKTNVASLKSFNEQRFNPKVVYETSDLKVVVAFFKQGQFIPVHAPEIDVVLCVLDGEAEIVAGDEVLKAKKNDLIIVPKGVERGVKALTELTILHVVQPSPTALDHEKVHKGIAEGRFR